MKRRKKQTDRMEVQKCVKNNLNKEDKIKKFYIYDNKKSNG